MNPPVLPPPPAVAGPAPDPVRSGGPAATTSMPGGAPPASPPWAPPIPPAPPGPTGPPPSVGAAGAPPAGPIPPARAPMFARPTRLIAVLVAVVAVAFDLAAHQQVASLAVTLLVGVTLSALVVSGRVRNRQALVVGLGAVVVAVFLSLRSSPWSVVLDVAAAAGLLALTAMYASGGSLTSLSGSALLGRFGRFLLSVFLAPSYAFACVAAWIPTRSEQRRRHLVAVARGIGLALPVVAVLALLLASADAVFASLFSVPDDLGPVLVHVGLFGLGTIVASALFVEVSSAPIVDGPGVAGPIGPTESSVVLGAIATLYGVFAVVQVVTSRGGAAHVMETAGLTYADHARRGFFQLLAVAALTLVVVCGLRAATRRGTRRQQVAVAVLSEVVVALTLVILAVALERLRLYEGAYGATMLRSASTAFALWLGGVFVLVAVASTGLARNRSWLTAAVALSAVVALVGWNVVNPEQLVVERNNEQARSGERDLDDAYLWALSDDAVPALAAALPTVGPDDRAAILDRICFVVPERPTATVSPGAVFRDWYGGRLVPGPGAPEGPPAPTGLAANRSATLAAEVRGEVCTG
jgi:hypothetical protein